MWQTMGRRLRSAKRTHPDSRNTVNPQRALRSFAGLSDPVATLITTGLIHATFDVRDAGGNRFILQRMSPAFSPRVNDNIQSVTQHLRARGVTTFELAISEGKPYADLGEDGLWRLMTCLPGISFDIPNNADQLNAAGNLVATFHRALLDYDAPLHSIGFPFHDTQQHIEDLQLALRECEGHPCYPAVKLLSEGLLAEADLLPSLSSAPNRVIHGDLKLNNILFEPAGDETSPSPVALIDLDTLARMPLAYDWGDALRSWCNRLPEDAPEAELDITFAEAAVDGLMSTFDATPDAAELNSLTFGLEVVSLELSIRFATDALRETHWAWDPKRFERAGEHNMSRARGQFDLYRQAKASHGERARHMGGG